MPPPLQIVSVVRRSCQGATRPFICTGDDGETYFVKSRDATVRSLVCEWMAGHLGRAFGLPIPAFFAAEVRLPLGELEAGVVFASRRCGIQELTFDALYDVPVQARRDVVAFDWWVRNMDRTLSSLGGNPNLFWDGDGAPRDVVNLDVDADVDRLSGMLRVFDHNLAFDPHFDHSTFLNTHAFADDFRALQLDEVAREAVRVRLVKALQCWQVAERTLPEAWRFSDPEATVAVDFDFDAVFRSLEACQTSDFLKVV